MVAQLPASHSEAGDKGTMSNSGQDYDSQHEETPVSAAGGRDIATFARRHSGSLLLAVLLVMIIGLLALASATGTANRPLYPPLPSLTPLPQEIANEIKTLTFTELNTDPGVYRDQLIQVSGTYTPLSPPDCRPWTGIPIEWSLVSEGLQLNAIGFETILRFVNPGTELTVLGYWRLYQGPLGCGKEPPAGVVWYLEVVRVLEPNPLLIGGNDLSLTVVANYPLPTLGTIEALTTPTPSTTPAPTATIEQEATEPAIDIETPVGPGEATETATLAFPGTVTHTPDPNATPTLETTPDINSTASPTPTVAGATTETPNPALPTSTPAGTGYPPDATNTPTGGYP